MLEHFANLSEARGDNSLSHGHVLEKVGRLSRAFRFSSATITSLGDQFTICIQDSLRVVFPSVPLDCSAARGGA